MFLLVLVAFSFIVSIVLFLLSQDRRKGQSVETEQEAADARGAGDVLFLVVIGGFLLVLWSALRWEPSLVLILITWIGVTALWARLCVYLEVSPGGMRASRNIWVGLFLVGLVLLGMTWFLLP